MTLGDRVRAAEATTEPADVAEGLEAVDVESDAFSPDPLADFKQRVKEALFEKLGPDAFDPSGGEEVLRRSVGIELKRLIAEEAAPLSADEREQIAADISQDILGFGPVQDFLDDPSVTEIMVNSTSSIFVERGGKLELTPARFLSDQHLRQVIGRMVGQVGRRVDEGSPMVDARLADGSRINAIIPPLAVDGPALTIRKFSAEPYLVDDLINFGTLSRPMAEFLRGCVGARLNILITGGTGSGKTTLLNVLSAFIPEDQRIVTIEDAVEVQLRQKHVIRLESRPPNIEGKGEVTIRSLVRNSLRMRPDRIVVGEVRGAESLDMLQAMNTGHEGSLSTLHANAPRDALSRLETMVLMADIELPIAAIREYISSAIALIVHVQRRTDGTRIIQKLTEVQGMEGSVITLQDIFAFDRTLPAPETSKLPGRAVATGLRPSFADHVESMGWELPPDLFEPPKSGRRG